MGISVETINEILSLAEKNKQAQIEEILFEQFIENQKTADEILDYARTEKNEQGQFLIKAVSISQLGFRINNKDATNSPFEFYKLASERDNFKGSIGCARALFKGEHVKKSAEKALAYVLKAKSIGSSDNFDFGHCERYQLANIDPSYKVFHRIEPRSDRLGTRYIKYLESYSWDIFEFLNKISDGNKDIEKKLAQLMIDYGNSHKIVKLERFQWLSTKNQRFKLGLAVAQARCIILIAEGFLRFAQVFHNNGPFSIYSNSNMFSNFVRLKKIYGAIDELYMSYLTSENPLLDFIFYKKN